MPRFTRRQAPPKFATYRSYKPYLRLDFEQRCAYCEFKEIMVGTSRNFVVEHFQPRCVAPDLECEYSNLYYACNVCNSFKSDHWPSDVELRAGFYFVDPCNSTPYREHYLERDDGVLFPITRAGLYTSSHLQLNREQLVALRRLQFDMRAATKRAEDQLRFCRLGQERQVAETELTRMRQLYIRLFL